jgi:hypothetical protein
MVVKSVEYSADLKVVSWVADLVVLKAVDLAELKVLYSVEQKAGWKVVNLAELKAVRRVVKMVADLVAMMEHRWAVSLAVQWVVK